MGGHTSKAKEEITLLGLVEAARRVGVTPGTLKGYADDGKLPTVRDSARRRLFFPSDIEAFARRRRAEKAGT